VMPDFKTIEDRDNHKCAKCQVKWKKHGMNVQSKDYHPMMWTSLEYLEWCSYNKGYEDWKNGKR